MVLQMKVLQAEISRRPPNHPWLIVENLNNETWVTWRAYVKDCPERLVTARRVLLRYDAGNNNTFMVYIDNVGFPVHELVGTVLVAEGPGDDPVLLEKIERTRKLRRDCPTPQDLLREIRKLKSPPKSTD